MLHFVRLGMMEISTSLSSGHVAIINTHIFTALGGGFSHSLVIICNVQMFIQTAEFYHCYWCINLFLEKDPEPLQSV